MESLINDFDMFRRFYQYSIKKPLCQQYATYFCAKNSGFHKFAFAKTAVKNYSTFNITTVRSSAEPSFFAYSATRDAVFSMPKVDIPLRKRSYSHGQSSFP